MQYTGPIFDKLKKNIAIEVMMNAKDIVKS